MNLSIIYTQVPLQLSDIYKLDATFPPSSYILLQIFTIILREKSARGGPPYFHFFRLKHKSPILVALSFLKMLQVFGKSFCFNRLPRIPARHTDNTSRSVPQDGPVRTVLCH